MPHLRLYRFHAVLIVKLATTMLWRLTVTSVTTSFQHFFRLPSGLENSMAKVMRRCMASSRSNGRFVAKMIIPGSTATEQGHTHALGARSRGLPRLPKSPKVQPLASSKLPVKHELAKTEVPSCRSSSVSNMLTSRIFQRCCFPRPQQKLTVKSG